MPDTDKATERELQRLRKLPENRICPNCLKEDRIGFKGVCMAFKTFICNDCKSAHQSFSHRTKSVDMSVWKMDEVRVLDERNGGGNRAAQRLWLAHVPDSERPTKESSLEVHKRFVERAYIDGRWKSKLGEEGLGNGNGVMQGQSVDPTQGAEAQGAAAEMNNVRSRRSRKQRHKEWSNDWQSQPPAGLWADTAANATARNISSEAHEFHRSILSQGPESVRMVEACVVQHDHAGSGDFPRFKASTIYGAAADIHGGAQGEETCLGAMTCGATQSPADASALSSRGPAHGILAATTSSQSIRAVCEVNMGAGDRTLLS